MTIITRAYDHAEGETYGDFATIRPGKDGPARRQSQGTA